MEATTEPEEVISRSRKPSQAQYRFLGLDHRPDHLGRLGLLGHEPERRLWVGFTDGSVFWGTARFFGPAILSVVSVENVDKVHERALGLPLEEFLRFRLYMIYRPY